MLSSLRLTIFASFRGGGRPHHAALAVVLGLVAGFVTGWNLSLAVLLLIAILFNLRTRVLLASWAVGLALSWLATGLTYRIGQWLLDDTPLGPALGDNIWIALFGWDRYTLVGGAALGLILALPAAKLAARFLPGPARADDKTADRWLRPHWFLALGGALAAAMAAPWWLGPELVERELLRQLAAANGAAVEARDIRFSLWNGELEIDDLHFADPLRLDRDWLRIGMARTQVDPGALMRGRVVADKLALANLRVDVARRQAADSRPSASGGAKLSYARPSQTGFPASAQELELDGCVRSWPEFRERLSWLGRLISGLENLSACDSSYEPSSEWPCGVRSALGRSQPRVNIRLVRAEDLAHAWGLGQKAVLQIANVTSDPASADAATRLEIVAPELTAEISAELHLREAERRHTLHVTGYECQLAELVEPAGADQTVTISSGKFDLQGDGWVTRDRLELLLQIDSKPLDVRVASHERLAGVDGEIWDQGLRSLGGFRLEAKLAGPWSAPVLSVNTRRLVEQFKHQLRAAGEHRLVHAIEDQLVQAEPNEPQPSEQVAESKAEAASESDFCTVTDDAPPANVANPFEGWRRARPAPAAMATTTSSSSTKPVAAAPQKYPRTAAPETDPADAFIATLDKSAPASSPAAADKDQRQAPEGPWVERTQYTDSQVPAVAREERSPISGADRALPGPINLVVGHQDRPTPDEDAQPDWPDEAETSEEQDYRIAPQQRSSLLARWADGMRDRFRRTRPARRSESDLTLPPEIDSPSDLGEEQPIDRVSDPPPQARRPWFPSLWR